MPHGNLRVLQAVQEAHLPKTQLAYMNITIQSYSLERWDVFKQFARAPFCYRTGKKPFRDYLLDMARCKFVIAPRGAGLDTYRLWEALYLDCIPVVKTSSLDILYEDLPILIVQDWKEVTEEFLNQKYEEFRRTPFNMEKTTLEYWTKWIDSYKTFP